MMSACSPVEPDVYFAVRGRALRFVQTFAGFANPIVLKVAQASVADVVRFGTPGSTRYFQIDVRLEHSESMRIDSLRGKVGEEREETQRFLAHPWDLRVVCTTTDVIRHEFLYTDICGDGCCGTIASLIADPSPELGNLRTEYQGVAQRAIEFAKREQKYDITEIVQVTPAHDDDVERFGTAGSDRYGEVLFRLEYAEAYKETMLAHEARQRVKSLPDALQFLNLPSYLRVVCSATNLLHHDWLKIDQA
ncbi:hypothetical protein NA78x_000906 [Anatilimnocola sp. NA78]|uniref:hypothetical protein n=1 Tax=Anatilimnocola sp. NA78 TaxID=3415683 RepID=UPI003CE52ACC